MNLSPDQIIFWQHGYFKLNATLVFTWALMALLVVGSMLITRKLTTGHTPVSVKVVVAKSHADFFKIRSVWRGSSGLSEVMRTGLQLRVFLRIQRRGFRALARS